PTAMSACKSNNISGVNYMGLEYWRGDVVFTFMYTHTLPPNSPTRGNCVDSTFYRGHLPARSYHGGGGNTVSCDGSVHFIPDGININIWQAYGTRAGGPNEATVNLD